MGRYEYVTQHKDPIPFLTKIPDWRNPSRIHYDWDSLWTLILIGLLTAPENILALSQWLTNQRQELCQLLDIPDIPSQATIYRFFWNLEQHLDPLQDALLQWINEADFDQQARPLVQLAADGKVLRGSKRPGEKALSFLSVFMNELALTVLQTPLEGRHEARVLDDLLPRIQSLFGQSWSITLDAAYTESGLNQRIVEHGGDFFVPLKKNTPQLRDWAKEAFRFEPESSFEDFERRSGETWKRQTTVQTQIPEVLQAAFPAAKTLIRREHHIKRRQGITREVRYAVSSRLLTAEQAEQVWRDHWGIENRSHARRDILWNEDGCWTRKAAHGLAVLRGLVIALLAPHGKTMTAFVRRIRLNPLACWKLLKFGLA